MQRLLREYRNRKNRKEEGAVVIEATLSLSFFMFMIVMLLSIVNICVAQARIGTALNQTAKEISQYTYFYTLSGINSIQDTNYKNVEAVRGNITDVTDSTAQMIVAIRKLGDGSSDIPETWDSLKENGDKISQTIAEASDNSQWVVQFIKLCGNEAYEKGKGVLTGILAKGLMQKHLCAKDGQSADDYLKYLRVKDGVKGLNLNNSVMYHNGSDNLILVCQYKIKYLDFIGVDATFDFCQVARTKVWGGKSIIETSAGAIGESLKDPRNLTGDELESYMVKKYGQGAIDEIKAAYPDRSDWTYSDWEYYIYLYAVHDPKDPRTMTSAQLKNYMIEKYGEGAVKDICSVYSTDDWEYDDWEYYIYLYASDPLPFSFADMKEYNEYKEKIDKR